MSLKGDKAIVIKSLRSEVYTVSDGSMLIFENVHFEVLLVQRGFLPRSIQSKRVDSVLMWNMVIFWSYYEMHFFNSIFVVKS